MRYCRGPANPKSWLFFLNDMNKQKVIVYVDGFNFYYGLKKNSSWKRYYWLNLVKLFEKFMLKNQELMAVKYFSARPINNEDKAHRQSMFFDANKENPKFHLIMGKYLKKKIVCKRCGFNINTYEEKESDVRIATQIVNDAKNGDCDIAIVVSADSDMIPAIELAKSAGARVYVFFPPSHHSEAIAKIPGINVIRMQWYETRFKQSVLPDEIILKRSGYKLVIPDKWKKYKEV
ncbi:MAG: NYN domain-containing protein [Bacteroidales bacterium]|nr:NYN domain-containing protein [Bacteroidales bacterium]